MASNGKQKETQMKKEYSAPMLVVKDGKLVVKNPRK